MKIAYIVTEPACMDKSSGAFQHITMGRRELRKAFKVIDFLPPDFEPSVTCQENNPKLVSRKGGWRESAAFGSMRDLRDLWNHFREAFRLARMIKQSGCEAAYVRVQALHPISLILRYFRIRVFLEANGLQFTSRKKYFKSWLAPLYQPFERFTYEHADHVFFVGHRKDVLRRHSIVHQ